MPSATSATASQVGRDAGGRATRRRRRGLHPSDRRDPCPCVRRRPLLDGEGLCHGRRPGRQPADGVRGRQVHQSQRLRRLRQRVAGPPAVDRAGQPAAVGRPRHHVGRAHLVLGGRALQDGVVRLRGQRRAADLLRMDLRGGGAGPPRGPGPKPGTPGLPPRVGPAPLPPSRAGLRLGRDRRGAGGRRARCVVQHAGPLVGGPPRRGTRPHRRRTVWWADPRCRLPLLVEPDAARAAGRYPLRPPPPAPPTAGLRLRGAAHGRLGRRARRIRATGRRPAQ